MPRMAVSKRYSVGLPKMGQWRLQNSLLDNKADVNAQGMYRSTALHRATLRGVEEMVRLLLKKEANPNMEDIVGRTPLHVASLKRHGGIIQLLLDRVDGGRAILD